MYQSSVLRESKLHSAPQRVGLETTKDLLSIYLNSTYHLIIVIIMCKNFPWSNHVVYDGLYMKYRENSEKICKKREGKWENEYSL